MEERLLSTKPQDGGPAFQGGTLPPPLELEHPWRPYPASDSDTASPAGKSPDSDEPDRQQQIDDLKIFADEP